MNDENEEKVRRELAEAKASPAKFAEQVLRLERRDADALAWFDEVLERVCAPETFKGVLVLDGVRYPGHLVPSRKLDVDSYSARFKGFDEGPFETRVMGQFVCDTEYTPPSMRGPVTRYIIDDIYEAQPVSTRVDTLRLKAFPRYSPDEYVTPALVAILAAVATGKLSAARLTRSAA